MIYDGPRSSSTIKALLCDYKTYDGIVSNENTLFLEFNSDGDQFGYTGFQFTFSVIGKSSYFRTYLFDNHTTWEIWKCFHFSYKIDPCEDDSACDDGEFCYFADQAHRGNCYGNTTSYLSLIPLE